MFVRTVAFGLELCKEYNFRYERIHKTQSVLEWLKENEPEKIPPCYSVTPPARAMPDEYKTDSPIQSYRNYYLGEKRSFAVWTKRQPPQWFIEGAKAMGDDITKYYKAQSSIAKKRIKVTKKISKVLFNVKKIKF